jgi:hypothetical protein
VRSFKVTEFDLMQLYTCKNKHHLRNAPNFSRVGMKAQWDEVGGRILLGVNQFK